MDNPCDVRTIQICIPNERYACDTEFKANIIYSLVTLKALVLQIKSSKYHSTQLHLQFNQYFLFHKILFLCVRQQILKFWWWWIRFYIVTKLHHHSILNSNFKVLFQVLVTFILLTTKYLSFYFLLFMPTNPCTLIIALHTPYPNLFDLTSLQTNQSRFLTRNTQLI